MHSMYHALTVASFS